MIIKPPAPVSSFLSLEKDMNIISTMILKNENLKKLLYYTTKDCLSKPSVPMEDALEMFGKQIKMVPKLKVDKDVLNYIFINFDSFIPNSSNPEFRDNTVEFDILCHYDQWDLGDFQQRPFRIAAEIDSMFNNKHLTGIGLLEFQGAVEIVLNDEFAGVCLVFRAVHGDEDKKHQTTPLKEENFLENFNQLYK